MFDPDVDSAYKTGAGRYIQDTNVLEESGAEIKRYGGKAFVIGGPTALSITEDRMEQSFERAGLSHFTQIYSGPVSYEAADACASAAKRERCDVIVGVGGGRIMDLSKAIAARMRLPVVTVPTSMATCAAYTPLSVMYTEEGAFREYWRLEYEVNSVLADLGVLSRQPARMAAAGIIDAAAKYIEIQNGTRALTADNCEFQFYSALQYAKYNYEMLLKYAEPAYRDICAGTCSKAVEAAVYLAFPLTGIVSALTRASGQSAIAHKVYDGARSLFFEESKPFLHGEIVGVGLIAQLYYNGDTENIPVMREMLGKLGLPATLSDIHIPPTEQNLRQFFDYIRCTKFVVSDDDERRLWKGLNALKGTS